MNTVFEVIMFIGLIAGVASVFFQYEIVQSLDMRGINAYMFIFLPSDVRKFKKILDVEENVTIKKEMMKNYYGYLLSIIIALSSILLIILFALLFVR
jgi:hypothetical protein